MQSTAQVLNTDLGQNILQVLSILLVQRTAEGQNTVEVLSTLKVQSTPQQKVQSIHLLKEQNILCSGQSFS